MHCTARIGFYRTVLCRRVLGAAHGPPTHGTGGTRGTRRQPNILGNGRVHLGTQGTLIQAKWVLFVYPEYSSLSPTVISGLEGCIMPLWAFHAADHGKPQRRSPQAYDTPFESPRWGLSKNAEKNMSRCHVTCPHLRSSSSNLESLKSLKIPDFET